MTGLRMRPDKYLPVVDLFDTYAKRVKAPTESIDDARRDPSYYVDLMTDVLHLAASRGVNYDRALEGVRLHFQAEVGQRPDDPDYYWPGTDVTPGSTETRW